MASYRVPFPHPSYHSHPQRIYYPHPPAKALPGPLPPQPVNYRQPCTTRPAPYPLNEAPTYQKVMAHAQTQAYFKESVNDTDQLYLPAHAETMLANQKTLYPFSFRPLVYSQHPSPAQEPAKPLQTVTLPTPNVLPRPVDVSKYETVSYRDWMNAPTEYQSLSPSSFASEDDPPSTPKDWDLGYHANIGVAKNGSFGQLGVFNGVPVWASGMMPATASQYLPEAMLYYGAVNNIVMAQHRQSLPHPHPDSFSSTLSPSPEAQSTVPSPVSPSATVDTEVEMTDDEDGFSEARDASDRASVVTTTDSDDEDDDDDDDDEEDDDNLLAARTDAAREQRDNLLVSLRDKGVPYKEIKRKYGFKEAESTLRGRFRALTKDKEERVRRPAWETKDVILLRRAVRYYCTGVEAEKLKVRAGRRRTPWKKVSEWMKKHGGSYRFAPATCARKWEEVKN
ncbi:hypothetical protein BDY17DRAFT_321364 [Neohortaea acidophila]|uniref:Myb-like domain-containing protein n=1 Tax=Neohortaea acidophila TaxID=245834 RepID=A0A6A6Q3J2_9PEZI|nr:uncharacterized protein BDY17DRAFT_321364 [Neohortaea acidophila]KAF2486584.1 hypothetical protein BDY17DRAFT_321364 [Neohortaea acidophila]